MLPKLEPDVLGMGVGLGVGVGVGVGEDSMDAGGPPSVGSAEAQPVLSNTQTPVSTKKVGLIVTLFASILIIHRILFISFYFCLQKYASILYIFFVVVSAPFNLCYLTLERQFRCSTSKGIISIFVSIRR